MPLLVTHNKQRHHPCPSTPFLLRWKSSDSRFHYYSSTLKSPLLPAELFPTWLPPTQASLHLPLSTSGLQMPISPPLPTAQTNCRCTWGARVLSIAAPALWIKRPKTMRDLPSLSIFRISPKTHFFKMTYNHVLCVVIFVSALVHLLFFKRLWIPRKAPYNPIKHYRRSNWFEKTFRFQCVRLELKLF